MSALRLFRLTMMIAPFWIANLAPSSLGILSVIGEGRGIIVAVTGSPTLIAGPTAPE